MADQADERLKALKASMKEALGMLTGSDELEAEGAREKSGGSVRSKSGASKAKAAPTPREAKPRPARRRP